MKIHKGIVFFATTALMASVPAEAKVPSLSGTTHTLQGTLTGKVTETWTGRGPQQDSNIRIDVSSLTTINFPCVNAWPNWKAVVSFLADGTFSYWDIDTGNPEANTQPVPVIPKVNDNWRHYTGTWTQKGSSVRLTLDSGPLVTSGEQALYRFYGVSTQPALPPAPPSFQGQSATLNTPSLFTGTESPGSPDFYYTYRTSFKQNPAYNQRSYSWKGRVNTQGHLQLIQSTLYTISDLQTIGYVPTNAEAPPPDLYTLKVQWIFTKSLGN